MKPVKTIDTNTTYKGPTPDIRDLPCRRVERGFILSEWDLTKAERIAIARGARVELGIYTEPIPPVHLSVMNRGAGGVEYVDEHGPFEAITPDELLGPPFPSSRPAPSPSRPRRWLNRWRFRKNWPARA